MNSRFIPPIDSEILSDTRTERDRAYQRLANQVLSLIAEGEFLAGARLPSERALAERFDVSRTSVREAIIALEIQGAVEVRGALAFTSVHHRPLTKFIPYCKFRAPGPLRFCVLVASSNLK